MGSVPVYVHYDYGPLLCSGPQETGYTGSELQLTMEDHMCTHSSPHTKLCLHFFTKQVVGCASGCGCERERLITSPSLFSPAADAGAAACGGVLRPALLLVGRGGAGGAASSPLHPPQWPGAAGLPQEPVHWLLPAAAADSAREAWPAGEGGARGGSQGGQHYQHCCHQRGHPVLRAVLSNGSELLINRVTPSLHLTTHSSQCMGNGCNHVNCNL